MSQVNDSRIIAPPIEEEIFPYRRVWRSVSMQAIVISLISALFVLLDEFLNLQLSEDLNNIIVGFLITSPVLLWIIFSVIPERLVIEPRQNLIVVAVVSGLTASAIGIPLIDNFFQIDDWIPLESAFRRILGFAFTVGIIDTAIKFIVLHFFIFPQKLRVRIDAIAFAVASAIGYSFVVNLYTIVEIQPTYSIAIILILSNFVMQICSSLFLAYGLSEIYFTKANFFILPIMIVISALVIGLISPFTTGLMNGPLFVDGNANRPLFSLGFLIGVLFLFFIVIFFLYNVAERRERESFTTDE